ncbi:PepSY domain-containing protein [Neobacillus pocheonensis]|uniref:PepSY domain-containing protein n=1 Tax=Neobacillus pocheonensis TaxID=363869 RepID=A0ABT0W4X1_9BACI|nr:PepSY domain-containing protein [Neobacillus pocheonensis]
MNWKSFILGVAVGAIGGYAVKELISNKSDVSPETVLELVKKQFKQNGPISGSWIHMEAEPYKTQQIHYRVYKGGISRTNKGEDKQYEFIADATTGTVLEVRPFKNEFALKHNQ